MNRLKFETSTLPNDNNEFLQFTFYRALGYTHRPICFEIGTTEVTKENKNIYNRFKQYFYSNRAITFYTISCTAPQQFSHSPREVCLRNVIELFGPSFSNRIYDDETVFVQLHL